MRYDGLTVDGTKGGLRSTMDKLAMMSDQISLMKDSSADKVDEAIGSLLKSIKTPDSKGVKTSSCGSKRVKTAGMNFNAGQNAMGDPIMKRASLSDLAAAAEALDMILEKKKF